MSSLMEEPLMSIFTVYLLQLAQLQIAAAQDGSVSLSLCWVEQRQIIWWLGVWNIN